MSRDPWKWILTLLNDDTLAETATYNSVRKYYCEGSRTVRHDHEERFIDEPNTADTWAKCKSKLPEPDPYPRCFLRIHVWLDEGLVTNNPGIICNASENGGGVLGAYVPKVCDPSDPSSRNASQTKEFARYEMEVYQKVLAVIFSSLKYRSWSGEPICCPDNHVRIFHSGILIESLDSKSRGEGSVPLPKVPGASI
ncbi:hypothetical protein DFH07DRAFT_776977 [Mycena maculata]|uniref:Uncharacterized protein n=1 Tax=Mycena maculata TaxID=230809 RepID=A0AAD7IMM7_9AGAR|nr:hypothetical protein DFH07DRAFT_776977 [Mycena maculata]